MNQQETLPLLITWQKKTRSHRRIIVIILKPKQKHLSIKKHQTFENYGKVGNTISASIPIALKDASNKNKLNNNNLIIIAGYGVGLSWGSALIKWSKLK